MLRLSLVLVLSGCVIEAGDPKDSRRGDSSEDTSDSQDTSDTQDTQDTSDTQDTDTAEPTCDDVGECSACSDCALADEGPCVAAMSALYAAPGVTPYLDCTYACETTECLATCARRFPEAADAYMDLTVCLYCDACEASCDEPACVGLGPEVCANEVDDDLDLLVDCDDPDCAADASCAETPVEANCYNGLDDDEDELVDCDDPDCFGADGCGGA